ncbi:MAG: eukaryotic-like serine/threonine-protein kinase [Thermoanaerobaculia bacterium]|jgi:Tol biopolymer transport system component/tRNA A-37 threonylcarbamoyl transferase component Bud32|nr:eukaryotic-like serine/threonine-protein kinase [Thermoanaerobaculia bacterium]
MSLDAGSRLGPYEIVAPIGAGGMGEVFKARDTRLDRNVAIKVLPSHLSSNPQLRERFDREARTISQLTHPHICTLYDVGHEGGIDYLVMELLDGEMLSDRLSKGPLPLDQVLRYGAEIASALDRAHRSGIVHRDLKPGNVMLTRSGAKLLDFGLASVRAGGSDGGVFSGATQATVAKPLTQEGAILGTFQYMAPEQLDGLDADRRTDIFALGALLYEMATGSRAFEGKTRTSLIAAIVSASPRPLREVVPLTPPALEHVIARCLEKDPEDRWQNAQDIAEELRWIGEAGSQAGVAASITGMRRRRESWIHLALAVSALAALVFAALFVRERLASKPGIVAAIQPPEGMHFNATGDVAGPMVISPNGQYLVYSAGISAMSASLYLQSLETGEAKAIAASEGATFPFWSPDSRSIAFFQKSKLKRMDIPGGAPLEICDAPNSRGGSWGADNVIVFCPTSTSSIFRVDATGGTPAAVTKIDTAQYTTHRWPVFLEDGRHFVYLAANHRAPTSGANALYVASVNGNENRRLMNSITGVAYTSGFLFYSRENVLYARKLGRGMTLESDPIRIADQCLYDPGIWRSGVSVSASGVLVYHSSPATFGSQLIWFDRTGKKLGDLGQSDAYFDIHLSPDEKKLAMSIGDPGRQVWIYDFERNKRTRLTFNTDYAGTPAWSPDGKAIYYSRIDGTSFSIVEQAPVVGRVPRLIVQTPATGVVIEGVSADGKYLSVTRNNSLTRSSHMLLIDTTTGKTISTTDHATQGRFSPDGRWLAYTSSEITPPEVFITSFPDQRARWQVSTGGGRYPLWSHDGREIYFHSDRGQLMTALVTVVGDDLQVGDPKALFNVSLRRNGGGTPYDISADGQRILANVTTIDNGGTVTLMSDWRTVPKDGH